jgi:hypothetical protein
MGRGMKIGWTNKYKGWEINMGEKRNGDKGQRNERKGVRELFYFE